MTDTDDNCCYCDDDDYHDVELDYGHPMRERNHSHFDQNDETNENDYCWTILVIFLLSVVVVVVVIVILHYYYYYYHHYYH